MQNTATTAPKKVFFNGVGLATALGDTVAATLTAIQQNRHQPTFVNIEKKEGVRNIPYHLISIQPPSPQPSPMLDPSQHYQLIDNVINEALRDAGLQKEDLKTMGLFVGSTSFDIFSVEQKLQHSQKTDDDMLVNISGFQAISNTVVQTYAMTGPVYTFNTACSSSANALLYAAEFIRSGKIDRALVLGVEFYNETTACGFSSLELISRDGMRPFDKNRDGLVLGEACGAMIISNEKPAHNFGIVAASNIADSYSITTCNPDGSSIAQAITQALCQANLAPGDIRLIKTHGTASLSNDESEAAGLQRVFPTIPPVLSIKPYIGHTLGACGIVELIVFFRSLLAHHIIPPRHSTEVDAAFKLDFIDTSYAFDPGFFLLNYFGFGGNNTALVISND